MSEATPPSLRIAILGVGGIGSSVALKLAGVGHHDVTVIARPNSARLEQLNRDKAIITTAGERADVHVSDSLDEEIPYDLVIVTVLAHQVAPLVPSLQRLTAKRILFLINIFDADSLRDDIGADRAVFGFPCIRASINPDDGKLLMTFPTSIKSIIGNKELVQTFNLVGIPSRYESNAPLWLRCRVPLCTAMESVCYTAEQRDSGATWSECMTQARGVHEAFLLIQRLGYDIYPSDNVRINRLPNWVVALIFFAVTRNKAWRKSGAAAVAESEALNDVLLEAASHVQPPIRKDVIKAMRPRD